ncbi:hypothetical protein ACQEUU_37425 [Nonomuraea sp. CA-218870]|uniref:VG15 protein n=1 Tax=Nonomuraea sp. CA-218870 TaxID=3239998 RepID=UPI003D9005CF
MTQQSRAAEHQAAQRALSARVAEQLGPLWDLIRLGAFATTVPLWIEAVKELLEAFARMSGTLAADYYSEERDIARARGVFVPAPTVIPDGKADASLRWATKDLWIPEDDGPSPIGERLAAAEKKAEGAAQKIVADVGRDTIAEAIREDDEAIAWARHTGPDACAFCALLVSRGPVFHTRETAGAGANRRFEGAGEYKFHNNCVPGDVLVDGPAAEVGYRRYFKGEMVIVRTAAGHELRITPNHPVLTDQGWVPAGLLGEGDYVVSSLNAQGGLLAVPDEHHGPSLIEDVWGALSVLGLTRVPGSAEDFHGDGTDGEVHVVRAHRLLGSHVKVRSLQVLGELELSVAGVRESPFALLGVLDGLLGGDGTASDGLVRSLGLAFPLLGRELARANKASFPASPDGHPGLYEAVADHSAGHSIPLRQREFTFARLIGGDDLGDVQRGAPRATRQSTFHDFARQNGRRHPRRRVDLAPGHAGKVGVNGPIEGVGTGPVRPMRFDPSGFHGLVDGADAYARLGRDLLERLTGRVERDRVIEVRRVDFDGHVFNLQTREGWYRANGVIVSNCDCTVYPLFEGQIWEPPQYVLGWDDLYARSTGDAYGTKAKLRAWRKAFEGRGEEPA